MPEPGLDAAAAESAGVCPECHGAGWTVDLLECTACAAAAAAAPSPHSDPPCTAPLLPAPVAPPCAEEEAEEIVTELAMPLFPPGAPPGDPRRGAVYCPYPCRCAPDGCAVRRFCAELEAEAAALREQVDAAAGREDFSAAAALRRRQKLQQERIPLLAGPRRCRPRELLAWAASRGAGPLRRLPAELVRRAACDFLSRWEWEPVAQWDREQTGVAGDCVLSLPSAGRVGAALRGTAPLPRCARVTVRAALAPPPTYSGGGSAAWRGVAHNVGPRPPRYIGLCAASQPLNKIGIWEEDAEGAAVYYDSWNGGLFGGARWPIVDYGGLPHIADGASGAEVVLDVREDYEGQGPALLLRWPAATRRRGLITCTPIGNMPDMMVDPQYGRGHCHLLRDELRVPVAQLRWAMWLAAPGDAAFVTPAEPSEVDD